MIVCRRASGRLGNQIFQIAYALSLRKGKEEIWINAIEEYQEYFRLPEGVRTYHAETRTQSRVPRLAWRLLKLLGDSGVAGLHCEVQGAAGRTEVVCKEGLLPITFIDRGYWQDEVLQCEEVLCGLEFKKEVVEDAKERFARRKAKASVCVFVHVRRGDYTTFRGGIALPAQYYLTAMEYVKSRLGNCQFVFMSDDPDFVHAEIGLQRNDTLVSANVGTELAFMTWCDAGIISNSSLSWWAGLQLLRRSSGLVVGPEFFLGWPTGAWDPKGLHTRRFYWLPRTEWNGRR